MNGRPVRIVHLTGGVPIASVRHAGGVLQRDVTLSLLRAGHTVAVLAPATRGNRAELRDAVSPHTALPEDWASPRGPVGLLLRASHRLNRAAHEAPIQAAHPPFVAALALQPRVWRLLRAADVIDLQWFAQIRLAPLVRLIAGPRPVIVGTFHDVVSQRVERRAEVAPDPATARRLLRAAARAQRSERRLGRVLDRGVVLSAKDRDLLIASGVPRDRVHVLPPLVTAGDEGEAPPAVPEQRVLFVGDLGRPENEDAVRWLIGEIWDLVRRAEPGAELRVVGGGASPALRGAMARAEQVVATGFVDDLAAEYRSAACVVVPLRDGAGVKFKTLEAMIAQVPTVATPIGAEGVGRSEDYVTVTADPELLARGILRALRDPAMRTRARHAGERLALRHSPAVFDRTVTELYATPRP